MQEKIEEFVRAYTSYQTNNPLTGSPVSLFEPANYLLSLSGKKTRPILVLIGYDLFDENIVSALPLAHAVEIFHNFTLMHDDIMDDAPLRRGKQTVHLRNGTDTAILSGDMMLVRAYKLLHELSAPMDQKNRIIRDFDQMAEDVCRGQQYDMEFARQKHVDEEAYLEMIKLKTSVLIGYSLKAGGVLAGSSKKDADLLYEYGLCVGMAFQLMDDYLDTFGNPATFGKQVGGDILENKKTLLFIHTMNALSGSEKSRANKWLKAESEQAKDKIFYFQNTFRSNKSDIHLLELIDSYYHKSETILESLQTKRSKSQLATLAEGLKTRTI
ncbi:MAG: geranylgeranyl diphosphate synthase type II [Bacteroidia bacterium]|jgi:geranylgeranyl diphosphate synthase type II